MTYQDKLSNLTFLIPIFNLKDERLENFKYVLSKIKEVTNNILVVEQVKNRQRPSVACKFAKSLDVKYLSVKIDDENIHKSKLINVGTDKINTEFVWVNDADCYLKFADIVKEIDMRSNFIQPYFFAKKLDESQSINIRQNIPTDIKFINKPDIGNLCLYGALSFIFRKIAFAAIGQLDEAFAGYGFEDNDLCIRVFKSKQSFQIIKKYGIHLWHEPVWNNVYSNQCMLEIKHGMSLDEINIFIGASYRLNIYSKIEIATQFRGSDLFLSNILNFLHSEKDFIDNMSVKLTWYINSKNEIFLQKIKKAANSFNDIDIMYLDDIGGHNINKYLDASIHSNISQNYSDIFSNSQSDILITLEDDMVPPPGSLSLLYNYFINPGRDNAGSIACLYEDRGCHLDNIRGLVCGENISGKRDSIGDIANTGCIPYNRVPGGFTAFDTNIVKKFLPLNIFNIEFTGWDWKISRDMLDNNIQPLLCTDILCDHLI